MPANLTVSCAEYMEVKLGVPAEEIPAMCMEMYSSHGTTMAGLVVCSMGPGRPILLMHAGGE